MDPILNVLELEKELLGRHILLKGGRIKRTIGC